MISATFTACIMEPKITVKEDYILVEPQGREFWAVLQSIGKLFQMSEYQNKNTIWLFHEGPLEIAFDDFYMIKDFIKKQAPDSANHFMKVAIVVETEFFAAMATAYTEIMKGLPREFKVFSSLKDAEAWITA